MEDELRPLGHNRKQSVNLPDFNAKNVVLLLLALAVVGFALYVFQPNLFKGLIKTNNPQKQEAKPETKSSGYSAVFLTNNQVYFGKLESQNSDYPTLKDVYYLRVDKGSSATASASPGVSLVKLGEELHGPSDEIQFNKDQILLIEDLKTDSRVFKAIQEHQKKK